MNWRGSASSEQGNGHRLSFGSLVDQFFPWALFGVLGWLLYNSLQTNSQLATLIERTGTEMQLIKLEQSDRKQADVFLQSQIEADRARITRLEARH